jgi:hypothetical protein
VWIKKVLAYPAAEVGSGAPVWVGDDYSSVIANCTPKQCPVREVDAGAIDDFLKSAGR